MKRTYIQPNTDIVCLHSCKGFLGDPELNDPRGSIQKVATAMDGNSGTFDDDDWEIPSNPSLWDE